MKGRCERCKEKQAEGFEDYCCVLCTLGFAMPGFPADRITKQDDGTTVIDLSKPLP